MTERARHSRRIDHLQAAVEDALRTADADALVHAGRPRDPSLRYCLSEGPASIESGAAAAIPDRDRTSGPAEPGGNGTRAVAITGDRSTAFGPEDGAHPARQLADALRDADVDAVLSPRHLPHDAALYLEQAGISIASSDVVSRARTTKTADERERIERAQAAATAGFERAAATLLEAAVEDGRLAVDGDPLTAADLRRVADAGCVAAGGFPIGRTSVASATDAAGALSPGEPIVVAVAARDGSGYRGRTVGTLIVEGEGGWERRAHVAVSRALTSGRAYCSSEDPTVGGAATELEAEIRAYGFDEGVRTAVHGIGLESRERPLAADAAIVPGSAVVLAASVADAGAGTVALSTLLFRTETGVEVLGEGHGSLEPADIVGS